MGIAYFNCFAGISGDMILGALVDAGLDLERLRDELARLGLSQWDLKAERVKKLHGERQLYMWRDSTKC